MRSKHIFRLRGSRERLETKEELEQLKKEGSRRARKKMETNKNGGFGFGNNDCE